MINLCQAQEKSMREEQSTESDQRLDNASMICIQQGAKLNEVGRLVLSLILNAEKPLTAYQLLDRLKVTHKKAVPPTIYRILDFLTKQGLIHKVERLSAFIPCALAGRSHKQPVQFLICSRCHTVTEIGDQAVSKALAHAARRRGFQPGKAVVEIDGLCAACAVLP